MIVAGLVIVAVALAFMPAGGRSSSAVGGRSHIERLRGGTGWRWKRHSSHPKRAEAVRWVDSVAAELRAGRPPRSAIIAASAESPSVSPHAAAAAALGGEVAAGLRADAQAGGAPLLGMVAACWSVAEGSGAGLAASLDHVLAAARADAEVQGEITAQLAAPRATARLLAALPLVGLMLGSSLGASPVVWLTGSPLGVAVLVGGLSLIGLGLWWTSRLVRSVERELATSAPGEAL